MAHILVIGGSRGIGLAVVDAALDYGHRVRAFSRSAARPTSAKDQYESCRGDALNEADVEAALDDIDIVVQALGISGLSLFQSVDLFSKATRVLIAAMRRRHVKRLIAVTGFGAGDSRDAISLLEAVPFRLVLGRAYDDKDVQERLIKKSDLDWTIVRPGILTNGPRTGRYQVLQEPSQWRNGVIARADVADFIMHAIGDRETIGTEPVLVL